jgi:hypothetical protein
MTVTAIDTHQPSAALAIRPGQEMWTDKQKAALVALGIKGASSADLAVFMHYCQKTGLDPFSKQIYLIGRRTKVVEYIDGRKVENWVDKQTIQVGIDGFRVIRDRVAERHGVTVEYEDTIWYDRDGGQHKVWLREDEPAGCVVTVVKDGHRYPGALRFNSYAARTRDTGELTGQWKTMPDHMIEKCLPGRTWIQTDRGSLRIRDIVNNKLPVKVRSIDLTTGVECWQPVVNWWRNGLTAEWVRIWTPNGSRGNKPLRLTPNHPVWTPCGWRDAGDMAPGDFVAVASAVPSGVQEQVILGSLLGDGHLGGRKVPSSLPYLTEAHSVNQAGYLAWKAEALDSLGVTLWERDQDDGTGAQHRTAWMRTRALPSLYRYRGMKPADMLTGLSALGLAVWFMDDGSFKSTGHGAPGISSAIHCCGFGAEFADAAVAWLESRWGIAAKVIRRDRNPLIAIGAAETCKLEAILGSWLHRDGARKIWHGGPIDQGHDGYAFVPVLKAERIAKEVREQRYDIEVAETHTFIAGGMVLSNCAEAFALRRAFPHDLGGIYLDDEMPQQEPGAPAVIRQRGRVTVAEVIQSEPAAPAANGNGHAPAPAAEPRTEADSAEPSRNPGSVPTALLGTIQTLFHSQFDFKRAESGHMVRVCEQILGRELAGPADGRALANLSEVEAINLLDTLEGIDSRAELDELLARKTDGAGAS